MSDILYKPSPWQTTYHNLPHNEALGAGSAGPGKTDCLIHEPDAQIAQEHERTQLPRNHPAYIEPGTSKGSAIYLRRTSPMLDETLKRVVQLFPKVDPGVQYNKAEGKFTFTSGYTFKFGHCHDKNDWQQHYSSQYSIILFDELTQFEEEQYDQIGSRLRSSDPWLRKMLKIRSMSNPVPLLSGRDNVILSNPHWVRDKFVEPHPAGKKTFFRNVRLSDGSTRRWSWIYLPAKLSDHPDPAFRLEYEFRLRAMKPHIRKSLLEGDWWVVAGAFFEEEWEPSLHVCDPFRIPSHWPRWRSMDWGYKKPGCVHWYAMDDDDNIFVEREYTFQGKLIDEVGRVIRDIEKKAGLWREDRSIINGPADTQLWEKRGDTGLSKAEEHAAMGISWTPADKASRERNAERVADRLKDHNHKTTTPGLVFFRRCVKAIETIPALPSDPNNSEAPLDGGPDHWYDSVAYSCAYASHGRAGIGGQRPNAEREPWEREPAPAEESGGGYGYGI